MDLSLDKLKEAVSIREQIDTLERRLNSLFGGGGSSGSSVSPRVVAAKTDGRRRPMSAATRAKLDKDYRIIYLERDPGRFARLIEMFEATVARVIGDGLAQSVAGLGVPALAAGDLARDVGGLLDATAKRPFAAVVHCLCEAP